MKQADKKTLKKESILKGALKLFASNGFYKTSMPNIATKLKISVGNLYNYFTSKHLLAQEIIKYTSKVLGDRIKVVNMSDASAKDKIYKIVTIYFIMAKEEPEMIEYFLRVYISNREVFTDGCEGMVCVSGFVTEIMVFFDENVESGELKNQDFFSAFGLFMGYLGGMVFLKGENVLPKDIEYYIDDISNNIYNALKA